MGKDFLRLFELAVASSVIAVPGAASVALAGEPGARPMTAAPTIRSVQLGPSGLTVEFSEPIRSVSDVDPSRFRLSFAYKSGKHPGAYSYYYEYYTKTEEPLTVYTEVGGVLRGKIERVRPNRIRIPVAKGSPGLDLTALCKEAAAAPASRSAAGVYLHYSASPGKPQIESERGTALSAIAPHWLERGPDAVMHGEFPNRPIPVSLVCR